MSNFSVAHLTKCITEKDKYKLTQQYLKEVEMQNESVYDIVNEVLVNTLISNAAHPTAKLYALRFFKDLIISAQFQLIDSLDESIIKQIVKISQFDKENKEKLKRGSTYFEQAEKRNKEPELEKVSYSYVLFATEIIYVLGTWHAVDENNEQTDYAFIYEKLINSKVPFPANDKELKFFKPEEKELFTKNYKEWLEKLPEIEEESDEDEKENLQRSKMSIKSKQVIPVSKETNIETKETKILEKEVPKSSMNYNDIQKLGYNQDETASEKSLLLEKQIKDLENNLETVNTALKSEQKSNEESKQKCTVLESKNSELESKCLLLETQLAESEKRYNETEEMRQRLHVESQQQKILVKKVSLEKTDIEEKLHHSLKETQTQLKEAQEKISRLEREIEQLNTIKNSYKSIMEDHNKPIHENHQNEEEKVKDLEKEIEELVEFYTKEQISFKDQIKTLMQKNEELEKEISLKETVILNIQSSLEEKNQELTKLKSSNKKEDENFKEFKESKTNETNKLTADFFNSEPELKIPIQEKTTNSMSQYLLNQTFLKKKIQENRENSMDTLKSKEIDNQEKVRNASLGKTEKSLEKRNHMGNKYSNGKTFHFSNGDPYKSNEIVQSNLQKRPYLGLGKQNGHSSTNSSGDLWAMTPKTRETPMSQYINNKKSSVLNLNRRRELEEHSNSQHYGVQTLIPYLKGYFPQDEIINQQNSIFFKSLCLFPENRGKQCIFRNEVIQIRLANNCRDNQNYVLLVSNISYNTIKVQIVSTHEEFKIIDERAKTVYSNSTVEYGLETKVKDLNIRYPVISLIISSNLQQKVTNSTFNIALPLTMLEFTEMKEEFSELCTLESEKIKILQSEKFMLNPTFSSLKECFPNLTFHNRIKSGVKTSKNNEEYWEGNLHHSFIENIDVYLKMTSIENQVSLEFWCRNDDKISENYSKVMIQTLMYLLQ